MRSALLVAAVLMSACTTSTTDPVVHGDTPGHMCTTANTEQFIGREGTSETGAEIMKETHSAVLRWSPPGYMLTMDYRADRVTIWLGADRKITQIKCG